MSLGVTQGAPPGRCSGVEEWRAVSRVLRSPSGRGSGISPGRVARAVLDDLVTTYFPADCRACGSPLLRAGLSSVCDESLSGLREQPAVLCVRCGEALDFDLVRMEGQVLREGLLCALCRMVPPEFARAAAYGLYEDELWQMVHLLKYEGVRTVAEPLVGVLARAIETLEGDAARELTGVAVPLFQSKQRCRGFSRTVLLAEAALAELRRTRPKWRLVTAHRALQGVKNTESQLGLTPHGGRRNLRGAFEVEIQRWYRGARFCCWTTSTRRERRRGSARVCSVAQEQARCGWRRLPGRIERWWRCGRVLGTGCKPCREAL